jgi:hypothetical protein
MHEEILVPLHDQVYHLLSRSLKLDIDVSTTLEQLKSLSSIGD